MLDVVRESFVHRRRTEGKTTKNLERLSPPFSSKLTVVKPSAVGADPSPAHVEATHGQELDHGDERARTVRRVDGNDGRRGSGDVVDGDFGRGHAQSQGLVLEQRRWRELRASHGRRTAVVGVAVVSLRRRGAVVLAAAAAVSAAAAAVCVGLFGRRQDAIPCARSASAAASWPSLGLRRPVRIEGRQGPPSMVISPEIEHCEPRQLLAAVNSLHRWEEEGGGDDQ